MPPVSTTQPKPTTIITGFLGAGKTTFLNHFLLDRPDTKFAIIENEYGEQNIDSELIIRPNDDIVELNNGCLCCTLNQNLYDILNTLFERRNEYDEVVIEAAGVANPAKLAEPFMVQPAIKREFQLTKIICLVDAEQIEDQLENTKEVIDQIANSDVLLINKTDLIGKDQLQALQRKLRAFNPSAEIVSGNKDSFPEIDVSLGEFVESKEGSFPVYKPPKNHSLSCTEEVASHTFVFDRPFKFLTLHHQISAFLIFQSAGLHRMKGLLAFANSDRRHIMQSVGNRLTIDERELWKPDDDRSSKIVFIGRNLQREVLQNLLTGCMA